MKIQPYKQTINESCLACCLLQLRHFYTGEKISQKHERDMLFHALRYSKIDFVAGHLDYFEKISKLKTQRYVYNTFLYNLVKGACKTKMEVKKINMTFIDSMIRKSPIVMIIDSGPLYKALYNAPPYHYPHWIVVYKRVEGKNKSSYLIYEPWEGKECIIPEKLLKECLKSYLCRIWGAPQLIAINI